MGKRIIIICEGKTEKDFCEKTLSFRFWTNGITIQAPLIKKSKGGIVEWTALKEQIEAHLKQDLTAYVSMLIDYYGITEKHNFPYWKESFDIADKNKRLSFLEEKMKDNISQSFNYRFIPYVQLHEFESLLFNDIHVFKKHFESKIANMEELENTFRQFGDNPEMINNNKETAPSKRLEKIISGYDKVVYGNILAETIGLENIRSKCPRFNEWITKLEQI
jgi:hypothetical protein